VLGSSVDNDGLDPRSDQTEDNIKYSPLRKHLCCIVYRCRVLGVMVFNATFNNISVISWRSVVLVEETGVPGENHRPVGSH